jgi:hypothetical protein
MFRWDDPLPFARYAMQQWARIARARFSRRR